MIIRLTGPSDLASARELRRSLTDGQTEVSSHWLNATGARVLAQESGRHLEADEASAVSDAFAASRVLSLVAIVNDVLVVEDEAYALDASPQDLIRLSSELAGLNFVLADSAGTRCILFTTDDFKLIAGPMAFITRIAGEPSTAREAFRAFAADQLEVLRPALGRADTYMNWVDAAE